MGINTKPLELSDGSFSHACQVTFKNQIEQDKVSQWGPGQRETLYEALDNRVDAFRSEVVDINSSLLSADQTTDEIWQDKMLSNEGKGQKCRQVYEKIWAGLRLKEEAQNARFNERATYIEKAMELRRQTTGNPVADELRLSEIRKQLADKSQTTESKFSLGEYYRQVCKDLSDLWICDAIENPVSPRFALLTPDQIESGRADRQRVMFPVEWWHREILQKEREEFSMLLYRARGALLDMGYFVPTDADQELTQRASSAVIRRQQTR